jgi:NADH-quinone oxidoreductase subunit A
VEEMLREYLPILVFLAVAIGLGLVLMLSAVVIAVRNPDPEKVSAYECGFNAFDDARMKFDVRFYLVSILFIIFDLEIAFLFPWAVAFKDISMAGFWSMMVFLGVLTIGSNRRRIVRPLLCGRRQGSRRTGAERGAAGQRVLADFDG